MPWALAAAGVAAVGSIAGSVISSNAASDASDKQAKAAQKGLDFQKQTFDKIQANLDPYMGLGKSSVGQLSNLLGLSGDPNSMFETLKKYPGYQFAYDEGMRGVGADNATKGLRLSGQQVRGAEQFGQGLASNLFQQYFQQLMQSGQLGENAAAGVGNAGVATGQGVANSLLAQGQAQASGTVGSANAINQGIGSTINNAIQGYQMWQNMPQQTPSTSPGVNGDTSFMSDPESKTDIKPADNDNMLAIARRMGTYSYRYKPGKGDNGAHPRVGPMADEFARHAGGDGRTIPMDPLIGILHGSVKSLADQVDELRRAHG
jgi:hypothetical protein